MKTYSVAIGLKPDGKTIHSSVVVDDISKLMTKFVELDFESTDRYVIIGNIVIHKDSIMYLEFQVWR